MPDRDLAAVLADLDEVVDDAVATGTALAYFPAMYRSVTAAVDGAIRSGSFFDDDALVERLTVAFADLYLDAYHRYRAGRRVPRCWQLAFEVAEEPRRRMILQHLLLGMNAHINYDLGMAAREVAGDRLPALYGDFIRVNEILFRMIDGLQEALGSVSPRLRWLDRVGVAVDEWLMRMSIRTARDLAWRHADHLCEVRDGRAAVAERDEDTTRIGGLAARRWSPVHLLGRFVAAAEPRDPLPVVEALGAVGLEIGGIAVVDPGAVGPAPGGGSLAEAARLGRRGRGRGID